MPLHLEELICSYSTGFDYIDCLQVATAVHHAEGMITLDKELKMKAQKEWKEVIEKENKKFKMILWEEYEKQS